MGGETIPEHLRDLYADWRWTPAWTYDGVVTTWCLDAPSGEVRYMKTKASDDVVRLTTEAAAMRWAAGFVRVPVVLDDGSSDGVDWLVTAEMAGTPAINQEWCADPEWLVPIVARGLRCFHDAVPVDACPFPFKLADALAVVRGRIDRGEAAWEDLHAEHEHLSAEEASDQVIRTAPSLEDTVVCHGDYCYPNVFIEDGAVTGYLDLGELGIADRWWDVAIGMWSTTWNVGPGYEELFAASYGIEIDAEKAAFYRLIRDLVP